MESIRSLRYCIDDLQSAIDVCHKMAKINGYVAVGSTQYGDYYIYDEKNLEDGALFSGSVAAQSIDKEERLPGISGLKIYGLHPKVFRDQKAALDACGWVYFGIKLENVKLHADTCEQYFSNYAIKLEWLQNVFSNTIHKLKKRQLESQK